MNIWVKKSKYKLLTGGYNHRKEKIMLKELKYLLNIFSDEELEDTELWINSNEVVEAIILEQESIDLITDKSEIKVNNLITKENKTDINDTCHGIM